MQKQEGEDYRTCLSTRFPRLDRANDILHLSSPKLNRVRITPEIFYLLGVFTDLPVRPDTATEQDETTRGGPQAGNVTR
jgi:hypothetical protein